MKIPSILLFLLIICNYGFSQSEKLKTFIFKGTIFCDSLKIPVPDANIIISTDQNEMFVLKANENGQFYYSPIVSCQTQKAVIIFNADNQVTEKIIVDSIKYKSICDLHSVFMEPASISNGCFQPIEFLHNTCRLKDLIAIDILCSILVNNENMSVELSGYYAPDEDNIAFNRAISVKDYLLRNGIDDARIMINCSDPENRPYYEMKCGTIPYYRMKEPVIFLNKEYIESAKNKCNRELYMNLMRCVLIQVHSL